MPTRRSFLKTVGLAGAALHSRRLLFADDDPRELLSKFGYGDVELAPGFAQTHLSVSRSWRPMTQ